MRRNGCSTCTAGFNLADGSVTLPKLAAELRNSLFRGLKARNEYLGDAADDQPFRIYQADGTPGITAVTDLDGDYHLVFKNPRALLSGPISGAPERIDELRIFITNGGISQTVHRVDPWTYSSERDGDSVQHLRRRGIERRSVDHRQHRGFRGARVPRKRSGRRPSLTYSLPIEPQLETNTALVRRLQTGGGGNVEQRVLVDVEASAATVDKIIVEDSQLYATEEVIVSEATPATVTFENIRFDLGYFGDESALNPNFYVVGRYYYNFTRYTPRVVEYVTGNSGPKHWVDGVAE